MDFQQLPLLHQDAVNRILNAIQRNQKKITFSMPVGTGKTAVIVASLREYLSLHKDSSPVRVLVITGSKGLQIQIAESLRPSPV